MAILASNYNPPDAVTQLTSTATAVSTSAQSGVITMFAGTLTALTAVAFTVNNPNVTPTSAVLVNVCGFGGVYNTNGVPLAVAGTVSSGSFVVTLYNAHATQATGANSVKIAYSIS